ncbi:uncharacterized protein BX663DRAFT_438117, partial [Cokeromyces recurvatus]|uniref:uncharacterized protein n=1 Tax=Cokeromyces recurvatus TaxID=90255 RepID=UPI0022204ADF
MSIQLNKDQRECKCSTCSQSELGYRVVHRHTARIHQEIDEDEANDNFATNDTKLFNISENEALPYFIMIFLTFFQANNLTITATESLFKFMNAILFLLGINYAFPSKLQTIKSKISANYASKDIKKYIVCEKCNAIYVYEEVIDNSNTIKKCSNRTLPSYANGMRARCNHPLVVKNASNDSVKPIKRYAYNSVKATLMKFFMRPTFEQKIEEWRSKTVMPGMMFDIFDGR